MKKLMMVLCITCSMLLNQGCDKANDEQTSSEKSTSKTQVIDQSNDSTKEKPKKDFGKVEDTFKGDLSIEEAVIFENEQATITAKELSKTMDYLKLKLDIENKTDKPIYFRSSYGSRSNIVNNTVVDQGGIYETVQPGKIAAVKAQYNLLELKLMGIKEVSSLGIEIVAEDEDSDELFTTGLMEIKVGDGSYDASNDSLAISDAMYNSIKLERIYDDGDINEDVGGVNVTHISVVEDKNEDQSVLVEFNNKNDSEVSVVVGKVSINGYLLKEYAIGAMNVRPGMRGVTGINMKYIIDDDAEKIEDLKTINNISFAVSTVDDDNDVLGEKTFKIVLNENSDESLNEENLVYDEDGIQVESKGIMKDRYDNYNLNLVIKNNTAGTIKADVEDGSLSIDSFMVDELTFSEYVPVNQKAIIKVELRESSLEDAGIEDVENFGVIELNLEIKDEDWDIICKPHIVIENK